MFILSILLLHSVTCRNLVILCIDLMSSTIYYTYQNINMKVQGVEAFALHWIMTCCYSDSDLTLTPNPDWGYCVCSSQVGEVKVYAVSWQLSHLPVSTVVFHFVSLRVLLHPCCHKGTVAACLISSLSSASSPHLCVCVCVLWLILCILLEW